MLEEARLGNDEFGEPHPEDSHDDHDDQNFGECKPAAGTCVMHGISTLYRGDCCRADSNA